MRSIERLTQKTRSGFPITELLLVLTSIVVFLFAAFIGYRVLKANVGETQIVNRFKLFATGLKKYAKDFYNSYPYIKCDSVSDWETGASSSNNVVSCAILKQYIGSFVEIGPWTYTAYTGGSGNPPIGGTAASGTNGNGVASNIFITIGYYTFTTEPVDNSYVKAMLNQASAYGLYCSAVPSTNNSDTSIISCTSGPVLVSGSNKIN